PDAVLPATGREDDDARAVAPLDALERQVVDAAQAGLLADEALCSLHGERVDGTAAEVAEGEAACEVLVEDRAGVLAVEAAVVDALRQADEVACETVASDVRDLPGPVRIELVPERFVQRSAVAGAARVVLAVGADEEERVAGGVAGEEVEPAQVVVGLELGAGDLRRAGSRGRGERHEVWMAAAV